MAAKANNNNKTTKQKAFRMRDKFRMYIVSWRE
jgi:hypothetical protein